MIPKTNRLLSGVLAGVLCATTLAGCSQTDVPAVSTEPIQTSIQFAPRQELDDLHLRDISALYENDPYSVVTMYLTVREGNSSEGTDHTWEEVNTHSAYYYDELGIDRYKVAALLQVGDENGPTPGSLGYGEVLPNATVQIRGQTSSRNEQKNYKIKLVDNSEGWRGQRTIALNKHQTEAMRFRNKLAYDLMTDIPQIMSLRTQFVHLYVRDLTGPNPDVFEDYGLYTQVEQLNKTALRAHGLDKNGYLYKVNFFEFNQYDELKLVTDPDYDEAAFNAYLEPKGSNNHARLLEVIDAVNDWSITSEQLLDTYFDRENLAYWMAFMMLMGNSDVQSRNAYLYSPLNGNKWYFYPWDNDASLVDTEHEIIRFSDFSDWEDGVTNYWANQLCRRAMILEDFRRQLDDAVEDLRSHYLTDEVLEERITKYNAVVEPYVTQMPDIRHLGVTLENRDVILHSLVGEVEKNYQRYKESLLCPMPFYVGLPEKTEDGYRFDWESSFSFVNENFEYHFCLSRDYNRKEIIAEADSLQLTRYDYTGKLEPGQYFIHVCATNESGYTTNCFDYYSTTDGSVYGTYSFLLEEDGSLYAYDYNE